MAVEVVAAAAGCGVPARSVAAHSIGAIIAAQSAACAKVRIANSPVPVLGNGSTRHGSYATAGRTPCPMLQRPAPIAFRAARASREYTTGLAEGPRELVWVSRDGTVARLDSSWQGGFGFPTFSPDGARLAVTMTNPNGADVWIRQMESGAVFKLTGEGSKNGYPSWTPDGGSVTYFSNAGGSAQLWTKPADGIGKAVLQLSRPRDLAESAWSHDGQWLIYRTTNVPHATPGSPSGGASDILAIRPGEAEPRPLAAIEFTEELCPALSPNGKWLAYSSRETGNEEVFVVPFPNAADAKWSISPDGGGEPVWSRDGRELFYRDLRGRLHVVEVPAPDAFSVGRNTLLFDARGFVYSGLHPMYAVSMDDQRMLMVRRSDHPDPGELIVIENWFKELTTGRR